jgi:hypothetical protein
MMMQRPRVVIVNDKIQRGYRYVLAAPTGRNFDPEFCPSLTPKEMLALGVFCGKYMTDCYREFPASWFARARLSPSGRDCSLNYFGVNASQPLSVWREKGWIHPDDPRGWFQWYCRYYMGRRAPEEDARQIGRWKAMRRHVAQIKRHCEPGDPTCRPRQRQALLGLRQPEDLMRTSANTGIQRKLSDSRNPSRCLRPSKTALCARNRAYEKNGRQLQSE